MTERKKDKQRSTKQCT